MAFLNGTDPSLRQVRTPTVDTYTAGAQFTAGSSTQVSLSADPGTENNVIITFDGITQHRDTYAVSGTTVTFDAAIATGVSKVEATYTTTIPAHEPADNSVTLAKIADGTQGQVLYYGASGAPTLLNHGTSGHFLKTQGSGANPVWAAAGGGKLVQMVSSVDGAVATGTTVFPVDDTIPQNTEGVQYMSLAITPTNASNKLVILFTGSFAVNDTGGAGVGSALFQDSTAGALAATTHDSNGSHERYQHTIQHVMAAGTTSATTFKIRAGYVTTATVTFNGSNTSRQFGGVNASSLIIWEYEV